VGRTIYASADRQTAFMELLAPYRTIVDEKRRALQPLADFMGLPLDELWPQIVGEWEEAGTMKASWLPRVFREGREIYGLSFPQGWWIDVTATETISALIDYLEPHALTDDSMLTMSDLTGDDRALTTAIAGILRDRVELDDGTLPLGIQFFSNHGRPADGTGLCWAYWLRNVDAGLDEPTTVRSTDEISVSDPAFDAALKLCRIKSR
jgi:hypothetical protein